jgi:trans-aconitate methyltransferase
MQYLKKLCALLAPRDVVVDLGCGSGFPVTQALATTCPTIGVDVSEVQLRSARRHAPGAALMQADMAALHFRPASLGAVAAFYSISHVPRVNHATLLARVVDWLRPRGLLVCTMGAGDNPDSVVEDWLGAPMFFSHFDAATNVGLLEAVGFDVQDAAVVEEDEEGSAVQFLWVIATKPA